MSKILRFSIIAVLAMAATACNIIEDTRECPDDFHTGCLGPSRYLSCENGEFIAVACDSGFICKSEVRRCVAEEAVCTRDAECPGALVCVDGKCMTKVGCFKDSDCAGTLVCVDALCVPKPCTEGEVKCVDGTTVATCVSGLWADSACAGDQICEAGKCETTESCISGDRVCANDKVVSVCYFNLWVDLLRCAPGQVCIAGDCEYEICTEGEAKCVDGTTVSTCMDGAWVDSECASGQICTNDKCMGDDAPIEGAPCSSATFAGQCIDNVAYACGPDGVVVRRDCASDGGKCLLVEDGSAWCAYDFKACHAKCYDGCITYDDEHYCYDRCYGNCYDYELCEYDGQPIVDEYGANDWMCRSYFEGPIYFSSCHVIDGEMHIIENRHAMSICFKNSKWACEGCWTKQETCDSCAFDGWEAVCTCMHGQTQCVNGTTVSTCVSGSWVDSECTIGQECRDSTCREPIPCDDEYEYSGGSCGIFCIDGKERFRGCGTGSCLSGECYYYDESLCRW